MDPNNSVIKRLWFNSNKKLYHILEQEFENLSQKFSPNQKQWHLLWVQKKAVEIQSTIVISNSRRLPETLRDIRTSTYQSCRSEENNKSNDHI